MSQLPFTVGVEIEFNSARVSWLDCADYSGTSISSRDPILEGWVLKTDATCGYELNSPILRTEEDVFIKLPAVLAWLKSKRASQDKRCGLHVHIGFPRNVAPEAQNRLFAFLCRYEDAFFALAANHRKRSTYCKRLESHIFEGLKNGQGIKAWMTENPDGTVHSNRYNWLNGLSFQDKGTLEFRIMESSLDPHFICGWINFLLHVMDNLINGNKNAVFSNRKNSEAAVPFQIHDLLQRSGSYGKGIVRDAKRAVNARKWVFGRYKQLYQVSFRKAVNDACNPSYIPKESLILAGV